MSIILYVCSLYLCLGICKFTNLFWNSYRDAKYLHYLKQSWIKVKEELNYFIINIYYKVLVIKTLCYWHMIKLIDQWRRIEYQESLTKKQSHLRGKRKMCQKSTQERLRNKPQKKFPTKARGNIRFVKGFVKMQWKSQPKNN